jgi:hypothetical protein
VSPAGSNASYLVMFVQWPGDCLRAHRAVECFDVVKACCLPSVQPWSPMLSAGCTAGAWCVLGTGLCVCCTWRAFAGLLAQQPPERRIQHVHSRVWPLVSQVCFFFLGEKACVCLRVRLLLRQPRALVHDHPQLPARTHVLLDM